MKIAVDKAERELDDVVRFTNARTKSEAIVEAVTEFNRRMRLAALVRYAGTCDDLQTPEELQALRRRD